MLLVLVRVRLFRCDYGESILLAVGPSSDGVAPLSPVSLSLMPLSFWSEPQPEQLSPTLIGSSVWKSARSGSASNPSLFFVSFLSAVVEPFLFHHSAPHRATW